MSADDDELTDESVDDGDVDPVSGKRVKKSAAAGMQLLLADFRRRAKDKTGAELQNELDLLVDRMIERHVAVAPVGLREELRDKLYSMLATDPKFGAALRKMKSATRSKT